MEEFGEREQVRVPLGWQMSMFSEIELDWYWEQRWSFWKRGDGLASSPSSDLIPVTPARATWRCRNYAFGTNNGLPNPTGAWPGVRECSVGREGRRESDFLPVRVQREGSSLLVATLWGVSRDTELLSTSAKTRLSATYVLITSSSVDWFKKVNLKLILKCFYTWSHSGSLFLS